MTEKEVRDEIREAGDIIEWLKSVSADVEDDMTDFGCDEPSIDVRLQFIPEDEATAWRSSGVFAHTGDSSYDQDHSGHWGCSSVGQNLSDDDAASIAEDLVDQVLESMAMSECLED